jgi:class 3 adenylate cyclase/tetratricopeptide (TPR) repeat protein
VRICPSCGHENADDARFCSQCATPLEPAAAAREERKVVTCLFCDLVGFTARAESMDPEDVRRLLQPYHAQVRGELERFGGTVEKFIGDAVMAVFGAPIAHEDDPERAVRAALSIRDQIADEGELEVRIGITTGEALVALGARPEAGEGMASGDVVNTAARLQAAAPTNGILVDETTFRATERAIAYEGSRSIEAKGKAEPIHVWEAERARARVSVERAGGASLVGRDQELTLLRETLARVVREREPQLVTLVGVPGIGKSRLVFELFETIETGEHGIVYWRHGRSLPYGEGVTFWALGEMVKAQAGILESDTPEQAGEKLGQAVTRFVEDEGEAAWTERQLRPLAGLEADESSSGDGRDESFAAWRRFLEAIADERPLVLVFEDLHWADDALLDFVDHLADWAEGVPLLVLATARPELLSRRPGWGGGKVNSATTLLSPLTEEETSRLLHALVGQSAIDADLQARLLEHAGGNPLYAEEFTRMLVSRPDEVVLPETVQGIIAARLDTLPLEEKELLQDAAVIGRTFWLGALGGERWTLETRLHSLARKEFVARTRRTSVAGEEEYAFRHALVRDVAYEQIPRAARVEKHRTAADWIQSLGRPEDHAEMVAYHFTSALEYAEAAGTDTSLLEAPACAAFRSAGDRALGLNSFAQAVSFYEKALELSGDASSPDLLVRYGRALSVEGDERAQETFERAAEGFLAVDDAEGAAEAHAFLTEVLHMRARTDEAYHHLEAALGLVRDRPPSGAKARVLTEAARLYALAERTEASALAHEAYEMAEAVGLVELAAVALMYRGLAKSQSGDLAGSEADLQRSLELARSAGSPEEARILHNSGSEAWFRGELARGSKHFGDAARLGARLGVPRMALASRAVYCATLQEIGAWDESVRIADELIADLGSSSASYFEYHPRASRAQIGLARGHPDDVVLADIRRAADVARSARDRQAMVPVLSKLIFVTAELGLDDESREAWRELDPLLEDALPVALHRTFYCAFFARHLGGGDAIRRLGDSAPPNNPWNGATVALVEADFERAADHLAVLGAVDEGYARLLAGEAHLEEGRRREAQSQLRRAIELYRPLGGTRYVRRGELLLAGAGLEIPA